MPEGAAGHPDVQPRLPKLSCCGLATARSLHRGEILMTGHDDLARFTGGSIATRQSRLPLPLQGLHRAVLRRFLETGSAPAEDWVRQAAAGLGLAGSAIGELEAAD